MSTVQNRIVQYCTVGEQTDATSPTKRIHFHEQNSPSGVDVLTTMRTWIHLINSSKGFLLNVLCGAESINWKSCSLIYLLILLENKFDPEIVCMS